MPTPTNDEPTTTQGRRIALVIGVNDTCSDILPGLNYALANAEAMAEVLEQKCDFTMVMPPLLGEQASSAKVKKAVLDLTRNRNDDDFLLLYFSGHGQQAYDEMRTEIRNTYLGTSDFNEQDVEDDAHLHVSMHWLRDRLFEKTNAKRVLIILDCCYAEDIRTGSDHDFDKLREQIQYYFDIPGAEVKKRQAGCYIAIAAAGYDTPADEREESVTLTRLLLKALRGEELALLGDRGQVTLDRLVTYVKHEMPAIQKPVISISDATGQECILVSYPDLVPLMRKPSRKLVAERPNTYIPFPHDPLFQERPGEFARLESLLLPSVSTTQRQPVRVELVGVTGMGGIGKTQLAVEFSYRYQQRFPSGIFWMPATGRDVFEWQTEFAKLAFNTGYLPPDDDPSNSEYESKRARHLCRYLASHADALLILDNVEQPELVTSALPALVGGDVTCSIIYTSRNTVNTSSQVTLYEVERLPEDVALHLLLATTRPEVYTDFVAKRESTELRAAKQVCERAGYLPLALVHLRGRLQQDKRATLTRLAEVLNQGKLTSLKQMLFATFRLSWEHVRDEDSRHLFQLACYFPEATPIPLWLLGLAAGLGEDAGSFEPLGEACLHLQEVSLFEEFEGEQVRLHPLVREFGQLLQKEEPGAEHTITADAIERLTVAFTNLNMLEQRTKAVGYLTCLEQVHAVRDYTTILQAGNTAVLERVERWLDRESHLLTDEAGWVRRLPELLYQQLFNRTVEEGKPLLTGKAPPHWLEQLNAVGAEDTTLIRILAGHSGVVNSVAFAADGTRILTGSSDGTARLWETGSGRLLHSFEGHSGVSSVAFAADGTRILTGSDDSTARLWEISSGREVQRFEGHSGAVYSVTFSPDGQYIVTNDDRGYMLLWRAQGPDRGRLLGMYVAVYEVGAVFWEDATHLVLVDKGGSRGYPNIYRLQLHGLA